MYNATYHDVWRPAALNQESVELQNRALDCSDFYWSIVKYCFFRTLCLSTAWRQSKFFALQTFDLVDWTLLRKVSVRKVYTLFDFIIDFIVTTSWAKMSTFDNVSHCCAKESETALFWVCSNSRINSRAFECNHTYWLSFINQAS